MNLPRWEPISKGDLKDLMKIALKMHETPFKKGARRVLTTLKIDDRRDKKGTLIREKESGPKEVRARRDVRSSRVRSTPMNLD